MTEEEARYKWCPMARYYGGGLGAPAYNKSQYGKQKCMASGCAMWKWTDKRTKDGYGNDKAMEGQCGLIQT